MITLILGYTAIGIVSVIFLAIIAANCMKDDESVRPEWDGTTEVDVKVFTGPACCECNNPDAPVLLYGKSLCIDCVSGKTLRDDHPDCGQPMPWRGDK